MSGIVVQADARVTALFLWTLQVTKQNGNGKKSEDPPSSDSGAASEDESDDEDLSVEQAGEGKPNRPAGKAGKAKAGFSMPFDTFIRITRPMGIHYPTLEHRVIEIEKGVVRLLLVRERSEQLLGEAATRPGIKITLEDVKQMELGLVTQRREETELVSKPKRGRRAAAGHPAPGLPAGRPAGCRVDIRLIYSPFGVRTAFHIKSHLLRCLMMCRRRLDKKCV